MPTAAWCSTGATFDAHMERAEAFRRFGSDEPLRQLDITLTVAGIPNRGSMYAGPAGILMFGNPKQNHPDDVAKITESFADLVNAGHQMQVGRWLAALRERCVVFSAHDINWAASVATHVLALYGRAGPRRTRGRQGAPGCRGGR